MDEIRTLLNEYGPLISRRDNCFISEGVEFYEKRECMLASFANGIPSDDIIGLIEFPYLVGMTEGFLFIPHGFIYHENDTTYNVYFHEVLDMVVDKPDNESLLNQIRFVLASGRSIIIKSGMFNKEPLVDYVSKAREHLESQHIIDQVHFDNATEIHSGAFAGGLSIGRYFEVNKLFDEERFNAAQGHGFAAERANNLYDKLTGHDAQIVGDDNALNGADRIVDGFYIQSKYYQTGQGCVNACFDENGNFRYMHDGKPMLIEVPSDKYDAAVSAMEKKITEGKIPGVSDPNEAKNIVRRGHFTYDQAKNIAKAGTIESVTYDALNGCIIAGTAFGLTTVLTLAVNVWNGEDFTTSIKNATYSGLKVGGTALITTVLSSQLSKAGLNSALVGSSEAIVAFMGPKASAILVNAFRHGKNIYGAAAMKSAAKLLRGNAITAGVTVVVLSSVDIVNIFRGRISGKQLFKNITNTASTVGGGTAGWLVGTSVGSIIPGLGTVIGGIAGSVVAGALAGKASKAVLDNFIEDDADEMVRILEAQFAALANDYLLNKKEAEEITNKLSTVLDAKTLKDMFASRSREEYSNGILVPIIEEITSKRTHIKEPTSDQMTSALKSVLEEIADANPELALA